MAKTNNYVDTNCQSLESIITDLRDKGANRIRVLEEDESGRRCLEDDELRLEVGVIYDHRWMKERVRRFLDTVDDTVRWEGREWSFHASVRAEIAEEQSVLVYDRTEECRTGNGMSLTGLIEASSER